MAGKVENLKSWKPGQSGNPAGKPKGTKHISTWIQEMMNDEEFEAMVLDSKNGYKDFKGAPLKAIIQVATRKALSGDKQWADWLANNGWKQQLDITSDGEKLDPYIIYKPEKLNDEYDS